MNITVFGLGYVGTVTGACLAEMGHSVTGIDVNVTKIEMINRGQSPVIEKELPDLVRQCVEAGQFCATNQLADTVAESDISMVCVGTPSLSNGDLDLSFLTRVAEDLGKAISECGRYHVVVFRSTMLPGTVEKVLVPIMENTSGKRLNEGFGVCYNPEFMREGNSVRDFHNPPMTVIGSVKKEDGDAIASLYSRVDAPLIMTDYATAEAVKYVCNAFHALKITFANEIGALCRKLSIDGHKVMEIMAMDHKLNISDAYLMPGFAFGGACLPKDLRALTYKAMQMDEEVPLLKSVLASNRSHLDRAVDMVLGQGRKKVGVLGLSFKAGTDDMRESPMVKLVETLIGKGYDVRIYDHNISMARLIGANRAFIEKEIPHIASILTESLENLVAESDVIVVGNKEEAFTGVLKNTHAGQIVIDLVRAVETPENMPCDYQGMCW